MVAEWGAEKAPPYGGGEGRNRRRRNDKCPRALARAERDRGSVGSS